MISRNYANVVRVSDMPRRERKTLQAAYRDAAANGGKAIHDIRYAFRIGDPFHEMDRLYLFPVRESRIRAAGRLVLKGPLGEQMLMPQLSAEIVYSDNGVRKSYTMYFCINPRTKQREPFIEPLIEAPGFIPVVVTTPRMLYVKSSAGNGGVQFAGFDMTDLPGAEWILSNPQVIGVEISDTGEELLSEVARKGTVLRMGSALVTLNGELFEV
ncbi:MAG: hypothetical protein HY515_03430 [Candidatus Aenigmarchaeota archaeon]|nr:hypothetical protein [Candidatus Aenigmarchaeota archaeon]